MFYYTDDGLLSESTGRDGRLAGRLSFCWTDSSQALTGFCREGEKESERVRVNHFCRYPE